MAWPSNRIVNGSETTSNASYPDPDQPLARPDLMEPMDAQVAVELFDVGDAAVQRTVRADEAAEITRFDRMPRWQAEPRSDNGIDVRPPTNCDVDGQFSEPRFVEQAVCDGLVVGPKPGQALEPVDTVEPVCPTVRALDSFLSSTLPSRSHASSSCTRSGRTTAISCYRFFRL